MDGVELVLDVSVVALSIGATAVTCVPRFARGVRVLAGTALFTAAFTPVLAPATIMLVPVPFGIVLAISLLTGSMQEVLGLFALAPRWNAVSAACTAAIAAPTMWWFLSKASRNKHEVDL
ncbi:hypothetical protein C0Q88_01440 [Ralstonia pickettii]|uniref:Uncharacterized protein n=1 Tax=Ralstonia pickettii TaxID=329 RepID=A0A2N4TUL8_RALPI|nr:hypothetical protein [Ralstonia pickettii]PLC43418.1 hypothetical protein C0Q88_01440 [Ralstonia pickettii]